MAKATPEMIDAACKAVIDLHPEEGFEWPDGFNDDEVATARENMTAGIEAALAAAPVPVEPVVKPEPELWRIFEDATGGQGRYWGVEKANASNDDDPILHPIRVMRETLEPVVAAHNAALAASPAPAVADVETMAIAFLDGFTHGNAEWEAMPEHHRENYREGIRAMLAASPAPDTPAEVERKPLNLNITKEWFEKRAAVEGDHEIGAGSRKTMALNLTPVEIAELEKLLPRQAEVERHPDDQAVDRFAAAMKRKLYEKRKQGASGWDEPEQCHIDYLEHLLVEQIRSRAVLDPIDIGNFAMMLYNRSEKSSHGR